MCLTCVFIPSARTISINLYFFLIGYSQPLLTSAIEMDEFVCPFTHFMFYCNVSTPNLLWFLDDFTSVTNSDEYSVLKATENGKTRSSLSFLTKPISSFKITCSDQFQSDSIKANILSKCSLWFSVNIIMSFF